MAEITVEQVRERFPDPTSVHEGGDYCVGGAFCMVAEDWVTGYDGFGKAYPSADYLANVLQGENTSLSDDDARLIAEHITQANDDHEFEDAWAWLRKGLDHA